MTISVEIGTCTFKIQIPLYFSAEYNLFSLILKLIKFHVDLYRVFDVSEHVLVQPDDFEIPYLLQFHDIDDIQKKSLFASEMAPLNLKTAFISQPNGQNLGPF